MSVWNPSGSGNVHVDQVIPGVSVGWSNMPYEIRPVNGRFCVYKQGADKSFGCHDTRGDAEKQLAALYASEGGKMEETTSYIISMDAVTLSEGNGTSTWLHALPLGSYKHPVYGIIDVTVDRVKRFADSVKNKIRGIDPSINYNHDNESSVGASGWVKDAQARSDGLWLFVEFITEAAQKVRDKKFRYFSIEYANKWEDPQGKQFEDVVVGGALTNRPFIKNLVPINLSEGVIDNAFDLVSAITGKPSEQLKDVKETHMDENDLQKIIDGVTTKLTEQFSTKLTSKTEETNPIAKLEEIEELKKLAEQNPIVKALLKQFEHQATSIVEQTKLMRETQVDAKLAEFDNSNLMLSVPAKELAREIMLGMPDDLRNKFWEFMEMTRSSQSFLVELGERSNSGVRRGFDLGEKSATQIFTERTNTLIAAEKIDYLAAVERVAAEDPNLYERYRQGDGAPKLNSVVR